MRRLFCWECYAASGEDAKGWRAYRADVPGEDREPSLVFLCPSCAEREFGQGAGERDRHVSWDE